MMHPFDQLMNRHFQFSIGEQLREAERRLFSGTIAGEGCGFNQR